MADMGVPFETKHATEGMAEGNPDELKRVHSPGPQGTKEAQEAHAYATASDVDPPVEINTGPRHTVGGCRCCFFVCVFVCCVCLAATGHQPPPTNHLLCRANWHTQHKNTQGPEGEPKVKH